MQASPQNRLFRCEPGTCINMSVIGTGGFSKPQQAALKNDKGLLFFQKVTDLSFCSPSTFWLIESFTNCSGPWHDSQIPTTETWPREKSSWSCLEIDWLMTITGKFYKIFLFWTKKTQIWFYVVLLNFFSSKMTTTLNVAEFRLAKKQQSSNIHTFNLIFLKKK